MSTKPGAFGPSSKPYHIEPVPHNADSPSDFVLDSYIMHIRSQTCACGHTSTWSELNEVLVHRTRIGLSGLRRLVPARRLLPGYLVATRTLTPGQTPACHICLDSLPSRSPGTSTSRIESEAQWAATLKRKYETPRPLSRMTDKEYIDQLSRKLGPHKPAALTGKKHIPSASDL